MDIFNNIPLTSNILCYKCSASTIELIKLTVKLKNVDFEINNKIYDYIFIGSRFRIEDNFFSKIQFGNKLFIICEKPINILTQHYIDITIYSRYCFRGKRINTEAYLYVELERDKICVLYLKSKINENIRLCEQNIKLYCDNMRYNLISLYSKDYNKKHIRLSEVLKNIKNYKFLLVIYNYSLFYDISMTLENVLTLISISKDMTLYLDRHYYFNNFVVQNNKNTIDLISELICIIYKEHTLENYIKKKANTININYLNNYFNSEKTIETKNGMIEYIISLNNNILEKREYTDYDYTFDGLIAYYSSINKFSQNKFCSIIFKRYVWGNILDGVKGIIKFNFGNTLELDGEKKGIYFEITNQIFKIKIEDEIYMITFYNDFKEFTGFREKDNYKVIGFVLEI